MRNQGAQRQRFGRRDLNAKRSNKVKEGRPHVVDMIKNREISLIINTVDGNKKTLYSGFMVYSAIQRCKVE